MVPLDNLVAVSASACPPVITHYNLFRAVEIYGSAELIPGDEVGTIIACAKKYRADLLILGMRKHWLLSGRSGQHLAEKAPCSVLGVR